MAPLTDRQRRPRAIIHVYVSAHDAAARAREHVPRYALYYDALPFLREPPIPRPTIVAKASRPEIIALDSRPIDAPVR